MWPCRASAHFVTWLERCALLSLVFSPASFLMDYNVIDGRLWYRSPTLIVMWYDCCVCVRVCVRVPSVVRLGAVQSCNWMLCKVYDVAFFINFGELLLCCWLIIPYKMCPVCVASSPCKLIYNIPPVLCCLQIIIIYLVFFLLWFLG